MSLFVLTVNNLSPALNTKYQEMERIARYTERGLQAARAAGGAVTSGNIMDDGGANVVGSWVYVPQAGS